MKAVAGEARDGGEVGRRVPGRMGRVTMEDGARPTLEAVARRAGVSRGTVSRVVNDSPRVSDTARAAVTAAIEELGYVPNRAARMLVTRRTDTVALIVSEPQDRVFAEPFFPGIVRGITAALADTDVQLLLAMAQHTGAGLQRYLSGQHVDGVMLLSLHADDPLPDALDAAGVPFVSGGRPLSGRHPYVDADNRDGARQAVAHLVATGRRRVATIAGPQDMAVGVDRLAGYRDGLARDGLPFDEALVTVAPDFSEEAGAAAMRELLTARPAPDAVFAASDPTALGALRYMKDHGTRVPDDVAVVGFDDAATGRYTDPPLTTLHQPLGEMGGRMVRMLLARIAGESPPPEIVPTHLIVRASG